MPKESVFKNIAYSVYRQLSSWFYYRPITLLHYLSRKLLIWTVKRNSYYVAEAYTQMAIVIAEWLQVYKDKRWANFYIEGKSNPVDDDDWNTDNWGEEVDKLLDGIILTFRRIHEGYESPEFNAALTEWADIKRADGTWAFTEDGIDEEALNAEDSPVAEEAWHRLREIECADEEERQRHLDEFAKYFQRFWS